MFYKIYVLRNEEIELKPEAIQDEIVTYTCLTQWFFFLQQFKFEMNQVNL